jgi:hypothetical protein
MKFWDIEVAFGHEFIKAKFEDLFVDFLRK